LLHPSLSVIISTLSKRHIILETNPAIIHELILFSKHFPYQVFAKPVNPLKACLFFKSSIFCLSLKGNDFPKVLE